MMNIYVNQSDFCATVGVDTKQMEVGKWYFMKLIKNTDFRGRSTYEGTIDGELVDVVINET
jgi:hypothetical protein